MATRYIGEATVHIPYRDRGDYAGRVVVAGRYSWAFDDLHAPNVGFKFAYDSPEAYDEMATAAVAFGGYFRSHNRGDDVPGWAPSEEVADAIDDATSMATNEKGQYEVRRSKRGPGRFVG